MVRVCNAEKKRLLVIVERIGKEENLSVEHSRIEWMITSPFYLKRN